ncbi:MAG: 16S rRNA (cytosine(1402)-N(4))-methyltransferase RsmH [Dehalococcoidia bacterium]|nr:16S rRNA (cytosine(1402)-N(4))-methyltransferase RsmH [Dehalococcoidia bacterium]
MVTEAMEGLRTSPGGTYVDCTLGAGGHSRAILERIQPTGRLLGIDADPAALRLAGQALSEFGESFVSAQGNFSNLESICREKGFTSNDGILFDLGISSMQLASAERGFSFQREAPLDMRFDTTQGVSAADIVNSYSEQEIALILWEYGEERYSRQIAYRIVLNRPILSTLRLAHLVQQVLGSRRGKIHPATRTFMALRIAVNKELESLALGLDQTVSLLRSQGRLVVISYHSLEDRIVKQFMRREAADSAFSLITKKVIRPTALESSSNPRSRSARLRVAECLA